MINPTNLNKVKNEDPSLTSPNLAYSTETSSSFIPKLSTIKNFFNTAKGILFLAEVFLILLVGINLKLSNDVAILDSELEDKAQKIENISKAAKKVSHIQKKLQAFHQIVNENPKLQNKINLVYATTPAEIELHSLNLAENVLNLNLSAPEGKDFAKFIISYLDTKKVDRIELNGAVFKVEKNIYDFSVTVFLKGDQ